VSARSNRLIDTDVLSAGFASLLSAGHRRRYTDANGSASLASAVDAQALRLPRRFRAVGVQAKCAVLRPGTTAGFGRERDRRQSLTPRPARTAMTKSSILSTREWSPSEAPRWSVACRWSAAPRGLQKGPLYNKAVDTDVLSAGFRLPTVRRSLLRYTYPSEAGLCGPSKQRGLLVPRASSWLFFHRAGANSARSFGHGLLETSSFSSVGKHCRKSGLLLRTPGCTLPSEPESIEFSL
jgi:hypothetical protein